VKKASYPVQVRKTFISPSSSSQQQVHQSSQHSQIQKPATPEVSMAYQDEIYDDNESLNFGKSNVVTQYERTFMKPNSSLQSSSPRTPEQEVYVSLNAHAPTRPATSTIKKTPTTPTGRPNRTLKRRQTAADLEINVTPKGSRITSTPFHNTTPKSILPHFQVIAPSPNISGINQINCDQNMTNEEIEKIDEIVGNIKDEDGTEFFGNAVSVTTRNVGITPGKYLMYKVMRV
jgi:hypothetical protein